MNNGIVQPHDNGRTPMTGRRSSRVNGRPRRPSSWLAALAAGLLLQLGCQTSTPAPVPQANVEAVHSTVSRDAPAGVELADRYDLARDEGRGGHTLERHVGLSDADLSARLRRERRISAASTYTDRATAERVVGLALAQHRTRIDRWLARQGPRPNLALDYHATNREPIGRSLRRRTRRAVACTDAVVVLRWDGRGGFYVLTSYPEASR